MGLHLAITLSPALLQVELGPKLAPSKQKCTQVPADYVVWSCPEATPATKDIVQDGMAGFRQDPFPKDLQECFGLCTTFTLLTPASCLTLFIWNNADKMPK